MVALDKSLDADPGLSHEFLQKTEQLLRLKHENPNVRLKDQLKETVAVNEAETCGIRAPKKSFMMLSEYEKRHGKARPEQVKTIVWKGERIQGVDVQRAEDATRR